MVCIRRFSDQEDELGDIQSDSVPSEVRDWLTSTFTRHRGLTRHGDEKTRFRSIVHAVQAGIFVERLYLTRLIYQLDFDCIFYFNFYSTVFYLYLYYRVYCLYLRFFFKSFNIS